MLLRPSQHLRIIINQCNKDSNSLQKISQLFDYIYNLSEDSNQKFKLFKQHFTKILAYKEENKYLKKLDKIETQAEKQQQIRNFNNKKKIFENINMFQIILHFGIANFEELCNYGYVNFLWFCQSYKIGSLKYFEFDYKMIYKMKFANVWQLERLENTKNIKYNFPFSDASKWHKIEEKLNEITLNPILDDTHFETMFEAKKILLSFDNNLQKTQKYILDFERLFKTIGVGSAINMEITANCYMPHTLNRIADILFNIKDNNEIKSRKIKYCQHCIIKLFIINNKNENIQKSLFRGLYKRKLYLPNCQSLNLHMDILVPIVISKSIEILKLTNQVYFCLKSCDFSSIKELTLDRLQIVQTIQDDSIEKIGEKMNNINFIRIIEPNYYALSILKGCMKHLLNKFESKIILSFPDMMIKTTDELIQYSIAHIEDNFQISKFLKDNSNVFFTSLHIIIQDLNDFTCFQEKIIKNTILRNVVKSLSIELSTRTFRTDDDASTIFHYSDDHDQLDIFGIGLSLEFIFIRNIDFISCEYVIEFLQMINKINTNRQSIKKDSGVQYGFILKNVDLFYDTDNMDLQYQLFQEYFETIIEEIFKGLQSKLLSDFFIEIIDEFVNDIPEKMKNFVNFIIKQYLSNYINKLKITKEYKRHSIILLIKYNTPEIFYLKQVHSELDASAMQTPYKTKTTIINNKIVTETKTYALTLNLL